MDEWVTELDRTLARFGLKLTEEGHRYYCIYVLCGKEVPIPNHFLEPLSGK